MIGTLNLLQASLDYDVSRVIQTSTSETYMHFDPTGTKYVSIGSASIQTWLSGLLYPQTDGTNGQVLKTDGAGNLGWVTSTGHANTSTLAEGTNLYYTDARADTRAQLKIDALVASAPGALDTLNELAAAIGDDANFSTTMTNSLAGKEPTIAAGTAGLAAPTSI